MKQKLYKPPKSLIIKIFDILFIGCFLIGIGLPIGSVLAQPPAQATTPPPTVTITAPPPYKPDINITAAAPDTSCAGAGTPIANWGQVTPDSMWMLLCSQCVTTPLATSTPKATKTPNPTAAAATGTAQYLTGTPAITNTPIATFTPAMTGTPTPTCVPLGFTYDNYLLNPQYENIENFVVVCNPISGGVTCSGSFAGTDTNDGADSFIRLDLSFATPKPTIFNVHVVSSICYTNYGCPLSSFTYTDSRTIPGYYPTPFDRAFTSDSSSTSIVYQLGLGGHIGEHHTVSFTMTVLYSGGCDLITPTPTSTPGASPTPETIGYCQSVSNNEQGFSWDGITYGTTECFDIGPYDLMGYWGPSANGDPRFGEIPWIAHVCLQEISFGNATIFNVTISLQIILYTVGVALIIRNMFVS